MSLKIKGTGSYVPEQILTNADLEKMVETNDEWIRTRTGIEERRLAAPEQATSDLAAIAVQRALEMAGIPGSELDAIIVATITPDHIFPSTACILQQKFGAVRAFCFDLEAACSGLVYSLEVARSLMKTNAALKHVLVVGAEKISSVVNWEDRNTCVLFGDGAAAVVLENDGQEGGDSIIAAKLGAEGNPEILHIPAGGSRNPASAESVANKQHFIQMAGRDTFKLAVNAMVSSCRDLLDAAGVEASQIRYLVPHQANYRIIKAVGQRLGIGDDNVYVNINRYGNTSAASIGICLDELARGQQLKPGDYLLLTAFGGGLTWGSILIRW
ncbi:beta-ketoacyl-ACP synthase III [Victivallis sp. Marseille-Q1083]|uniref:beta-ketoacyl-ACP synthase III n=1 Tax=Victivallis sp. Marseille-Q1083 TaxID=2717288 RepID=UPI00158C93F2|nr:beta-ketoacyl-ACP synthase III [Victivallis sp. Marseille-Q1083]